MDDNLGTLNKITYSTVMEQVTKAIGVSTDHALNSIVVPSFTNATIERANVNLRILSLQADTSLPIKLEGAQGIQVKESVAGAFTTGITLPDDCIGSNGEMLSGIKIPGSIDVSAEVASFNKTYNFQWNDLDFEGDDVTMTVIVELDIYYSLNTIYGSMIKETHISTAITKGEVTSASSTTKFRDIGQAHTQMTTSMIYRLYFMKI